MSSISLRRFVAAVVVCLVVGACGGGANPPPPTAAPAVTGISPSSGPARGGTALTITGTGFAPGVTVTVGGQTVTGVAVASATTITGTTAAHAAGSAAVVVTNPDGRSSTGTAAFTYVAAPVIASVSPGIIPTAGGAVVIQGESFASPVQVRFGGLQAASVSMLSSTQIAAAAPAHAAGLVDVVVQNADGQQATVSSGLAYSDAQVPPATLPPTLTALSPASGRDTGGDAVTLTGTQFDAGTIVTLGGVPATVVALTGTSLGIVTPAHADGAVDVSVANGAGSATLPAAFTYAPPLPPTLSALNPAQGPSTGGTTVTLTGSRFDQPLVKFGTVNATVLASSPTSITVTSPPGTGTVAVSVTNVTGLGSTLAAAFTYTAPPTTLPPPTIAGMTPATASVAGGQTFTITSTGHDFFAGATVTFGGTPALNVVVSNIGDTITGVIPAGAAGPAPVVVRNIDGQTAAFNAFSYVNPPPVILALNVEGAPVSGGSIFIAGTGFSPNATVTFAGVPSPSVVQDPATGGLTVQVPAYTGPLDPATGNDQFVPLVVTNPDTQTVTWAKQFHYGPPPAISSLADQGPGILTAVKKGDAITVTGVHFSADASGARAGLQVTVAGTVCTITSKTATQIVFTAPKANPGSYVVVVVNFDKQLATSSPSVLTYAGP